jgi:hypothetical protein
VHLVGLIIRIYHDAGLLNVKIYCTGLKFVTGDCVVVIATSYGLDGPGIKSRWEGRFSAPVETGPWGPTRSLIQRISGHSWG